MASQPLGRPGVMLHPSLPTIKETTLSWLGSDLENSLFSTNGRNTIGQDQHQICNANVQRYIDFDDQCLSLKSGEGSASDFSGIQPLPVGSDDTPPMAVNEFNRVVRMDFNSLLTQNRPKPLIQSDVEDEEIDVAKPFPQSQTEEDAISNHDILEMQHETNAKSITPSDFEALIGMLDTKMQQGDIGSLLSSGDNPTMEKLQLIRLWQLMQQQELRQRQEAEIAMLSAQRQKMKIDRQECQNLGLEKVMPNEEYEDEHLEELESGDLESNFEEVIQTESEDLLENEDDFTSKNQKFDNSQEAFDEIPVEGEKKSFEQLLEDELRKEEEAKRNKAKQSNGQVKRPFLRKGQGLARFNGPPIRKPSKGKKEAIISNPKSTKQDNLPKGKLHHAPHDNVAMNKNVVAKKPPTNISKTKQKKTELQTRKISQKSKAPNHELQHKSNSPLINTLQDNQGPSIKPVNDTDLEEFEMLERYAEDDASFFNEPSLVVSVLQQERDVSSLAKEENRLSLRERVRERRKLREEARAKIQEAPKMNKLHVSNHSQFGPVTTGLNLHNLNGNNHNLNVSESDDEVLSPVPPKPYFKSPVKPKTKVIQRKTASLVKKEKLVPIRPIAQSAMFSPIQNKNVVLSNPAFAELQSSPHSAFSPHHNHIVTSEEQDHDNDCHGNGFEDEQTWGDIDISVLNLSLPPIASENEEEKKVTDSGRKYKVSDYMEPENEDIENPVRDTDDVNQASENQISLSPAPPPTMLMQKLFPGLKLPKSASIQEDSALKTKEDPSSNKEDESVESPDSQASILKQKLQELETEIAKFKKENTTLENLRKKQEDDLKILGKEMEEFRKQKEEELARFDDYKKTETKKLKKERKLFEEHVLATRMMPRKEEREEIQKLQEELDGMQSDHKAKEQRWISANNRMRNQAEKLEIENKELNERIKEMEAQRVKEWNTNKSNRTKKPSVWKSVNEIVESTVFETENGYHDQAKLNISKSSNGSSHSNGKRPKSAEKSRKYPSKSKGLSPEVAYSNLKDTIEQSKPKQSDETLHKDGKVEKTLKDGGKVVIFPNGTQKEISSNGQTVKVRFANGDIKQIYADGSIVYFYEENGTTHTTHTDGLQVYEFPNKQVEHHFPDGTKQITFPDQTIKYLHTDGTEQTVFPDGTEMHVATNKDKTIVFANGQREIHTESFKRREYPDGTSKTVFGDGRQETRYASGRLRVKDAHGNVIVDRMAT